MRPTNDPSKASAAIPAARHGRIGEPITGEIVILALPYGAISDVLSQCEGKLDGKVVVDVSNPLDFETFDSLVVLVGSSAAEVIAERLPAGAKVALAAVIERGGLRAVDAGSLKRAHELEALGFLQLTLGAGGKTSWTSGFALAK
ncbi:MAG: 8-hydroxy-5-deazaflavin:NADPH oxidoreductase [Actinomycetota bacterium]|jgi:predicted dinucleotide-binding enzyme|nr:8-hydroxy-5-deazaflavin:NADPH oxidoreductase [Actinomycetota bacterium]